MKRQDTSTTVITDAETKDLAQREAWEREWAVINRIGERNKDKDPDEVLADVTEVVEEVRQERYEAEQRAAANRR